MAARRVRLTILLLAAVGCAYGQGSLSGAVLNASDGSPIPGVTVTLGFSFTTATTGPDGRFQFLNLKPDSYYLKAEKQGFAKIEEYALRLAPGETVSNLILRLSPESAISGRIRDAKGQPLRAAVTLTRVDYPVQVAFMMTGSEGAFRLASLPAGRYKLSAQGPSGSPLTFYPSVLSHREGEVIQLNSGEQRAGVDIVLRELKTVTVRGRYQGPVPPGELLTFWPDVVGDAPRTFGQGGVLDAERRFTVQLAAGEYRLKILTQAHAGRPPNVLGHLLLSVADADIDNVFIPASPIREIRARFRWLANNTPLPGEPSFMLNPTTGLGIFQRSKPESDGSHLARGVSADRYSIMISGLPDDAYVHSILAAGADITTSGLDLITGTATDLDILVAPNGADVYGTAPPGASIWIERVSAHRTERELFHNQTVADAAGKFVKSGIAPGEYRIGDRASGVSSAPQTIRVSAGQRLQITFP